MKGIRVFIMGSMANLSNETSTPDDYRLLQSVWDLRLGHEDFLRSPLFPVFLSVVFYFSLCLPFMVADLLCTKQTWYKHYKIQPEKEVSKDVIYDTLSLTFWNHVLFIMPAAIGQWIWTPPTDLPSLAPTLYEFVGQQVAALVVFDFQYFVWHLTHHRVRFLYKHIHSVHHRYNSPFVWVTQYLHPWELVTVGFLTTTNTWFFESHPMTIWSYMIVSIVVSVEAHIGFDFPFLLHNLDPTGSIGGSPKHDMHHQRPMTNFAPFFNHLDKLFGSFCPAMSGGGMKSKALQEYERRVQEGKKFL